MTENHEAAGGEAAGRDSEGRDAAASVGAWTGRSVFLTGHTGFKGSWLTLWLCRLGAQVHGYALDPPTSPSLFEEAGVAASLSSDTRGDVRSFERLRDSLEAARPDVVFHLAAQPLVLEGYRDPLGTLAVNAMGTAHLLEAVRAVDSVRAVVVVTTDKVYEEREPGRPYREGDPLGGRDPYSASKTAAEAVSGAYRWSFFGAQEGHPARVATARAGNVIGGGDWAADRLLPDCLRAFAAGETVRLRFPGAIRPWQHVLESLAGYLTLAERLLGAEGGRFAGPWNFGPLSADEATVGEVAQMTARLWGGGARLEHEPPPARPPEAGLLRLDASRAQVELGWRPRWALGEALERTVAWHQAWLRGDDMTAVSLDQIAAYEGAARA
ncbi:MAG: CDP-glucose 4,6-dehydratase [Actinobacteria bacterium]|nr:CDP-glucose 4,6-dehydratase [Actinomycetota bacterium]